MLSAVATSLSEAATQSKDLYLHGELYRKRFNRRGPSTLLILRKWTAKIRSGYSAVLANPSVFHQIIR